MKREYIITKSYTGHLVRCNDGLYIYKPDWDQVKMYTLKGGLIALAHLSKKLEPGVKLEMFHIDYFSSKHYEI